MTQTDLFTEPPLDLPGHVTELDVTEFRARLISVNGWQTRRELCQALGWEERKVRAVAQAMGGNVIRGQLGYKLTDACTRDDLALMQQAADAAASQSRIQASYAVEVRRAIHSLVG